MNAAYTVALLAGELAAIRLVAHVVSLIPYDPDPDEPDTFYGPSDDEIAEYQQTGAEVRT